jgi:hypothetical protein
LEKIDKIDKPLAILKKKRRHKLLKSEIRGPSLLIPWTLEGS